MQMFLGTWFFSCYLSKKNLKNTFNSSASKIAKQPLVISIDEEIISVIFCNRSFFK